MPLGRCRGVKCNGYVRWISIFYEIENRVHISESGAGVYTFGVYDRVANKSKVRSVNERHAVEEIERFFGGHE